MVAVYESSAEAEIHLQSMQRAYKMREQQINDLEVSNQQLKEESETAKSQVQVYLEAKATLDQELSAQLFI